MVCYSHKLGITLDSTEEELGALLPQLIGRTTPNLSNDESNMILLTQRYISINKTIGVRRPTLQPPSNQSQPSLGNLECMGSFCLFELFGFSIILEGLNQVPRHNVCFSVLQFTAGESLSEPAHQFAPRTSPSDPHPENFCWQEPAHSAVRHPWQYVSTLL